MRLSDVWRGRARAAVVGSAVLLCAATTAAAAGPAADARSGARAGAGAVHLCRSYKHNPALADRMSRDIQAALRGRSSVVAVGVDDPHVGVACWLRSRRRFYSASVVKATILAALLLEANTQHRSLTPTEKHLARIMITRSSIPAADALWAQVGRANLQRFLNLAHMRETALGPGGWWGLTRITTHDETHFLWLLMKRNSVLTRADRRYELRLMGRVIPSQRWGVRAGAPKSFGWHIKNGWVPSTPYGWLVNSIGGFTHTGGQDYTIVVLTHSDPTMAYGIRTIEGVAIRVNHDLHPGAASVFPLSASSPSWGTPDEPLAPSWRR